MWPLLVIISSFTNDLQNKLQNENPIIQPIKRAAAAVPIDWVTNFKINTKPDIGT